MEDIKTLLIGYASKYETADFLPEDPSWFMHQVEGQLNQETLAFIASCLSYGSRKQFFPKIQYILDCSNGNTYEWVKNGEFDKDIPCEDTCYYRLYSKRTMNVFLHALKDMIVEHGSIGNYVRQNASDGSSAVAAICGYFFKLRNRRDYSKRYKVGMQAYLYVF